MQLEAARTALRELLTGLGDREVSAVCLEALRRWRATPPPVSRPGFGGAPPPSPPPYILPHNEQFQMHGDLGTRAIPLLAQRKGVAEPSADDINAMKEAFIACLGLTWMSSVVEFVWWLERSGLAVVMQRMTDGYPTTLRLTKRGAALLDRSDDDPLIPGHLDRIKQRYPDLPDGVVSLLVDARACFDNSLLRPAVMLMGVAYELAIESVIDKLQTKGLVPAKTLDLEAGMRLRRVREFLRSEAVKHVVDDRDDRRRIEAAYDFADQLRLWRNDAAHTKPAYDYENAAETETILAAAGWHLSGLWLLATAAS